MVGDDINDAPALARADIDWMVGDITEVKLSKHRYDLWHDRAVFHFLTRPEDRKAYVEQVASVDLIYQDISRHSISDKR